MGTEAGALEVRSLGSQETNHHDQQHTSEAMCKYRESQYHLLDARMDK
jgi:hypothetical protein